MSRLRAVNGSHCEVRTEGVRCTSAARFHVVCHECGHGLVCAEHLADFVCQVDAGEQARCNLCGRVFDTIFDAIATVEL